MYSDRVEEKRKRLESSQPRKKQFGERAHKKTTIPYDESKKCHKLMSFDEEEDV